MLYPRRDETVVNWRVVDWAKTKVPYNPITILVDLNGSAQILEIIGGMNLLLCWVNNFKAQSQVRLINWCLEHLVLNKYLDIVSYRNLEGTLQVAFENTISLYHRWIWITVNVTRSPHEHLIWPRTRLKMTKNAREVTQIIKYEAVQRLRIRRGRASRSSYCQRCWYL